MGFGHKISMQTPSSGLSAFSRAVSAVRPFEVREGMEGEHTPETDLSRHHQDFEDKERFESSDVS